MLLKVIKSLSLFVCAQVLLFCPTVSLRQRGQRCSQVERCEPGLHCRYPRATRNTTGVCAAVQEAGSCKLGKSVYQNRESFRPSCAYQCVCRDGQISCVPRCNLDIMLAGPDCPFPRKVHVPGECCEKWVCGTQAELSPLGGFALAAYRQEETVGVDLNMQCIKQSTEWSACSQTCGMGVSTRVSNQNRRCEMLRQSRLCLVRPCHDPRDQDNTEVQEEELEPIPVLIEQKQHQSSKCLQMQHSPAPIHFTYRNCTSIQLFRPRFCGQCTDGRCCTPHATKTAPVQFRCPNSPVLRRPVMFIVTCVCHNYCPQENAAPQQSTKLGYGGLIS